MTLKTTFRSRFINISDWCVIERPQPPASSPVVCVLSSHSLVLSWSGPCYDGGSAITNYVVEVQHFDSTRASRWTELSVGCKDTSLRVSSGLQPQAEYRFRVRACNAVGLSDPSPESQVIRMENVTGEKNNKHTRPKAKYCHCNLLKNAVFIAGNPQVRMLGIPLDITFSSGCMSALYALYWLILYNDYLVI